MGKLHSIGPAGAEPLNDLAKLRQWVQFHENPKAIALWERLTGPLLDWACPARRRTFLALGALAMIIKYLLRQLGETSPFELDRAASSDLGGPLMVAVILLGIFAVGYLLACNYSSLPSVVRGSPLVFLHGCFWSLLVFIWVCPTQHGLLWDVAVGLATILPFFLWRLGYMFLSAKRGKVKGTRFRDQLMYLWPLWGGSNTPYGKGLDYLSRTEAKDRESLARSQLAGIRLLMLAGIWTFAARAMDGLVFGADNFIRQAAGGLSLGLPRLSELVHSPNGGSSVTGWVTLYSELFANVLNRACKGHLIIGVLRLFGFYVFRNTYKPLLAQSVVGFWNRYYYYFKELLVEFFFYPTFARWFRDSAKLRLFAAVFMAAFVGNMYYHLIKSTEKLVSQDIQGLWAMLGPRLVYCLLLALGIFVSMLREQRRLRQQPTRSIPRKGLAIFGVWTFFAVINIWNQKDAGTIENATRCFLGLLGLN